MKTNKNKEGFLLELLLDSVSVKCRHYQRDEEPCRKDENFLACNCDGEILKCDLWDSLIGNK